MKVQIEFPGEFESNRPGYIPLGRIYLGDYAARLVFCPDGLTRMAINKKAIDRGFIMVYEEPIETELFGFGKPHADPSKT